MGWGGGGQLVLHGYMMGQAADSRAEETPAADGRTWTGDACVGRGQPCACPATDPATTPVSAQGLVCGSGRSRAERAEAVAAAAAAVGLPLAIPARAAAVHYVLPTSTAAGARLDTRYYAMPPRRAAPPRPACPCGPQNLLYICLFLFSRRKRSNRATAKLLKAF